MAIEGYDDIYLDREQDILIHSILCGDLNNLATLKPAFVYNNSQSIEEGTFYFSTKYGNYSYTFKPVEDQPEQVQLRGFLGPGQTQKEQMKIDYCLVKPLEGAPAQLNTQLTQTLLTADDPSWTTSMEKYALIAGRPAFAAEQYQDPRAMVLFAQYDLEFYENNKAIVKKLEDSFEQQSKEHINKLPEQFKQALAYAKQEDGATKNKQYPPIAEPAVWTPTSKALYEDKVRMQQQERAFDELIQQTFDWLFTQIGKESNLVASRISETTPANWVDNQRQQSVTLSTTFDNGKTLSLIFKINSAKANAELFESLETIKEKSNIKRQSLDIQRNQPRAMHGGYSSFDVYSPVARVNLFFSQFRADPSMVNLK
jgi:hypothetical protein